MHQPPLNRSLGFTLLEVMLVLLLMGLAATFVVYNAFGSNQGEILEKQAKRFEVVFAMASDYAVLNQQQLGVRVDKDKNQYVFMWLDEDQIWRELSQEKVFAPYPLPEEFRLELNLEDLPWVEEDSLFSDNLFDEESAFDEDVVQIGDEEEKRPKPPQILLLSSGEITPFSLAFLYEPSYGTEEPRYYKVNGEDSLPLKREGPLTSL